MEATDGATEGRSDPGAPRRRTPLRVGLPVVALVVALGVLVMARPDGGAGDAETATSVPATIAEGGEVVPPLPDPAPTLTEAEIGGIRFRDVTVEAGLSTTHADRPLVSAMGMTSGAAVADVDGDGWDDVFLTRVGKPNGLLLNQHDGTFRDVTADAGLGAPPSADPAVLSGSSAAAFADVDGDGDLDLFVASAAASPSVLYLNDGSGRFTDGTAAAGLGIEPIRNTALGAQRHGVTFHDVNRDGWLDLTVTHWDTGLFGQGVDVDVDPDLADRGRVCGAAATRRAEGGFTRVPSADANSGRLYLNDGTGHFEDATEEMGLRFDQVVGFTADYADVDGDGWDDLLLAGDACTSRLYRNVDGKRFEDVTDESGVGTDENGMGSVVRDIDGDGDPDWFVTSIAYPTEDGSCPARAAFTGCTGNRLYLNDGTGHFEDATDRYGLRNGWWGWGAAIEDFGNDGRLEVAMTNGYVEQSGERAPGPSSPQTVYYEAFAADPMRFWIPTPDRAEAEPRDEDEPRYEDAAAVVGLVDTGIGHALVSLDYDGDGRLDVLVADTSAPPRLFRNESPADRAWLDVRLDDPTHPGNRAGIGARVEVTVGPGDEPVVGWIGTAGSYESQKRPVLHVGLDEHHGPVAEVAVWWPGAAAPQVVRDVAAGRALTVTRG